MATAGNQTTRKPRAAAKTVILSAGDVLVALSGDAVQLGEDGLPSAVRLFAKGINKTSKGDILFDDKAAELVLAAQEKYGNEYFFDYGHASLSPIQLDPAHAGKSAAWHKLSVQDGALWTEGLRWTKTAQEGLASGEWRYFSPAVRVDPKTNRVVEYINTALVNRPATYGMRPLVMSEADGDEEIPQESPKMKLVLSALGLGEAATEAEALDAVTKVRNSQKQLVALTGKTDTDEALGVVAAWKLKAEEAVKLSAQLEKIESERKEAELVSLVDGAVEAGKLPPSLKEQALKLGRENIGFVKSFIETLSSKVAPEVKLQDKRPEIVTASAALAEVAAKMGLSGKLSDIAKHQPGPAGTLQPKPE